MDLPKYDSNIPDGHAFQERRPFFSEDQMLRRHGFMIAYRRKGEEPVWSRLQKLYTHSQALELCSEEDGLRSGRKLKGGLE
jgi:hypothetical protein